MKLSTIYTLLCYANKYLQRNVRGAQPVLDINDIMILLGKKNEKNIKKTQKEKIKLESMEKLVYTCTDLYAKNLEEIASRVPCTISELLHILVSLELKGLIREVSRNYYVRTGKYEQ